MSEGAIGPELIERWALHYLERYASSAGNLRQVLRRRARRHAGPDRAGLAEADVLIAALVTRYCESGLIDDEAFAATRAQTLHRRGEPLVRIRARLQAKGVESAVAAEAVADLREAEADPDLAAACAFARRRRLGPYRSAAADHARELRAFARVGFDRGIAERVLACPDIAAVEALARGEDG